MAFRSGLKLVQLSSQRLILLPLRMSHLVPLSQRVFTLHRLDQEVDWRLLWLEFGWYLLLNKRAWREFGFARRSHRRLARRALFL